MKEPEFSVILKEKRDYYGNTEAAIEFAADEYHRRMLEFIAVDCLKYQAPPSIQEKETMVSSKIKIINGHFSLSKQEEIFMYLSIISALIAYRLDITWMVWAFAIKAFLDFIASVSFAIKEIKNKNKS